ncbi:MAG: amino acid adenylation domain-containing protein [Vicinamibacterales bacterium]
MNTPRSILEIVNRRAQREPGKMAFLALPEGEGQEIVWTYRDLLDRSLSIAGSLRDLVPAGERVLLLVPGGLTFLQAFFGCMLAGCLPVPLPPLQHRRHLDRIRRVQRDCLATTVIVPGRSDLAPDGMEDVSADLGLRCLSVDALDAGVPGDVPDLHRNDMAFLQYTSGSTGDPKGAIVTHAGILANQRCIRRCFAHDEESVVVGWLPLFHDMGLIGNILQSIYCGIPCVLLPTARVLQHPVLWLKAISRYRATTSGGPDFMYSLCARRVRPEDKPALDLSSWKVAFNGSEPIRPETLSAFATAFGECGFRASAFLPCYGLAEATLFVTGQAAGRGARVAWAGRHALERGGFREGPSTRPESTPLVGCGRTWGGTRIEIIDPESGEVLPTGRVGEVLIQGDGVVPGYWGHRNSSATFAEGPGRRSRVLRTGDLGFIDDGDLFVVGRLKETLVVRGRNLYAADIESVAQSAHAHLAGRRAAVFALDEHAVEAMVLVHEAPKSEPRTGDAICHALRARLAEELGVTPDVILLARPGIIPVTTSGKVQRRACRGQVAAGELPVWHQWRKALDEDALAGALVAAVSDPDAGLSRLLAQLPTGVDGSTSVLALGLDSVQILRLSHEIEARTGVRLTWRSLAEATLDDLVRTVTGRPRVSASQVHVDAPEPESQSPVPLSPGQLALWYLHLLDPKSPHWHLARSLQLEGVPSHHALAQALRVLMARHPSLRARVAHEHGAWVQTCPPVRTGEGVHRIDASVASEPVALRVAQAAAERPFDPERGTLFRALCFDRAGGAIVQLAVHHLAADLWSVGILLREFLETYERFSTGRPAQLPPLRGRYSAFARRQSDIAASPAHDEARTYWQSILDEGMSAARAGREPTSPATSDLRASGYTFAIPAEIASRVRRMARLEGQTAFAVLLSAFQVLLGRLTGASRSLIGTVLSGRADAELSAVVGYFAKAVPMRMDLSGDPAFRTLVSRVSGEVRKALSHQSFPIEALEAQARGTRPPRTLFDTVFVYQGTSVGWPALTASLAVGAAGDAQQIGNLRVRPLASKHAVPQFSLVVTVTDRNDEFLVHVSYRLGAYSGDTARWLGRHFLGVLEDGLEHSDARVSHLECWPVAERAKGGPGPIPWPSGTTLHGEFEKVAAAMADRVAVSAEQHLTYGVLDREADRLASRLPIGEEIVGICLGRTAMVSMAVLGILKSGAGYLPVVTTWPKEYVAQVLNTAGVRVVVTSRDDEAGLPDGIRKIYVDGPPSGQPGARRHAQDAERAVAYLIHTSGSTGDPKAVSVSHGHVLRLFASARQLFDFTRDDVWTLFHAISFDFSVWELWGALAHGGRLEIPSREVCRDPAAFHNFLVSRQVTVLNQTPTAFAWLQRYLVDGGTGAVRYVVFGGEQLDFRVLAPSFASGASRPTFVNMYGITETTVHVTCHRIARDEVIDGGVSYIGKPLPDLQTHVLNASMRPVPVGAVGEIYVGGAGVANGYWRRPEATAERFVPDPFTTMAGRRLYRTGDMARRLADGGLAFVGRRDKQVKVRGHRIELGAIESALLRHGDLSQVVVLFRPPREERRLLQLEGKARQSAHAEGGPPVRELLSRVERQAADAGRICAFVVRDGRRAVGVAELREFASQSLPDYMVPSRWMLLDSLPRTVNGKVDTRALLAMISDRAEVDEAFVPPRNPLESMLAEIWSAALGVSPIGIDDNLFELGCDSIRSLRIVGRARESGFGFTLAQLLDAQTIRALATVVTENQGGGVPAIVASAAEAPGATPLPAGVEEAYPLARLQEGILYHCALDPDPSLYRDVFLYHFRMPLESEALRESLRQVTGRHAALRTSFDFDTFAEPMQLVHRDVAPCLEIVDDWQGEDPDRSRALLRWAETERRRALPMDRPPLLRVFALADRDESFHLGLSFHDTLLDGWSASWLLGEIVQRYQHALAGTPMPVAPLPRVSFRDFVMAEREEVRRPEAREFWRRALETFGPCLAGRHDGAGRGELVVAKVPIPPDLSAQLIALPNTMKVPLKSALLAVHLRVLASWLGKERVVTGLESNGRLEVTGADEPLGLHLNTLPFAFDLGRGGWTDLVQAAFAGERALWPFRRFPLAEIKKVWQRGEIFDSVFNFTHFHHLRLLESLKDVTVLGAQGLGSTHFALRAEFNRDPFRDLLQLDLELDAGRFSAVERNALVAAYGEGLRALAESGQRRLPHHHFAPAWGAGDPRPSDRRLPSARAIATMRDTFDEVVRLRPDAVALSFDEGCLTYHGLDRAASAVAHRLRAMGLQRGERVGICVQDPMHALSGMIAALKLSCPYVPLDPKAPLERIGLVMAEARLGALIAGRDPGIEPFAARCARGILTLMPGLVHAGDTDTPFVAEPALPDDVVYVIFTSGTTGSPKGVPVNNRNLRASLEARRLQYPEEPETFILLSPLFFDSSVAVVLGTLSRGGTVSLPPAEVPREPGMLADWICRHQVTHMLALPRVYAALLDVAGPPALATLRRVIVAGEACQPAQVLRHFRVLPGTELTNEYGPTESTVWSTAFECREYRGHTTVPIGRAVAGLTVRLLGPAMQPVPPGGDGEIYLSGPAVVRGYFFRPELTAGSFVPDPFSADPGARLYRTGDRARMLPGGGLEFLGRTDRQIKVRGHRVEPSEVEAILVSCPGVVEACVSIEPVTRQLVSFVTRRSGFALEPGDVRRYAARWLPEHMRPRRFHVVSSLPRTSTGKLDLTRLELTAGTLDGSPERLQQEKRHGS